MNFTRKSTIGWSIVGTFLDFTGGVLSFSQQFIDSLNTNNWGIITSNIPKLLLAVESVAFDVLFFIQNYVLYKHSSDKFSFMGAQAKDIDKDTDGEHYKTLVPELLNE